METLPDEKIAYMLDFDGTVTESDLSTALALRHGGTRYLNLEKEYRKRRFGMKRWLKEAADFLPGDLEKMLAFARERAVFRPGFRRFLQYASAASRPVYIASDGFGFYIEPVLEMHGCREYIKRIYKNEAAVDRRGKVKINTVHAHARCPECGNCKAAHVLELKKKGYRVIYAGDGSNDRFGAFYADTIFARDRLARICRAESVTYIPWRDFHDLVNHDHPVRGQGRPAAPFCDPEGNGVFLP